LNLIIVFFTPGVGVLKITLITHIGIIGSIMELEPELEAELEPELEAELEPELEPELEAELEAELEVQSQLSFSIL
jgi:hypothetical protein